MDLARRFNAGKRWLVILVALATTEMSLLSGVADATRRNVALTRR